MQGYNGIYWGWNPDIENGTNLTMINKATSMKASTYGIFSQITNASSYDGHQLLNRFDEIKSTGAVLIANIMPTGLKFSEVGPSIAADIAAVVQTFTDAGVEVWVRFAHEMNYYASTGYYEGTSAEFLSAWYNVSEALVGIDNCLLFWSPNNVKDVTLLDEWWPGSDYVQIVGLDQYSSAATDTFANQFGSFVSSPKASISISIFIPILISLSSHSTMLIPKNTISTCVLERRPAKRPSRQSRRPGSRL